MSIEVGTAEMKKVASVVRAVICVPLCAPAHGGPVAIMTVSVALTFVATCVVLAITPGPNMSLIVANTLASGLRAGLLTLAGAGTGLSILVALAAVGMSSVMVFMSDWFDIVRWVGALYLVVLGMRQLWGWWRRRTSGLAMQEATAGSSQYIHGLLVSLSNPKVLLFLGAFLPQFVDAAADPVPQLTLLAILFVATLLIVDLGYTLLVARARERLSPQRLAAMDGIAGALLLAGGLVLATARRP
jgi:threonine/homoserine/homoserine lactone efflux protein